MSVQYNKYGVKITSVRQTEGQHTWIFIPGGPGFASSYLLCLVNKLELAGHIVLLDFCGNDNTGDYLDYWFSIFVPTIKEFQHPVLVGHSFGGMIALMFPELEQILDGIILLNTSPKLWMSPQS